MGIVIDNPEYEDYIMTDGVISAVSHNGIHGLIEAEHYGAPMGARCILVLGGKEYELHVSGGKSSQDTQHKWVDEVNNFIAQHPEHHDELRKNGWMQPKTNAMQMEK